MIKLPSYLQRNQHGIYYFQIANPKPLQVYFGKKAIKQSLKKASRSEAVVASKVLSDQDPSLVFPNMYLLVHVAK